MGRRIPADETSLLIHPLLSLSFFAVGMAATVAIITALCSFRRKSSSSQSPASNSEEVEADAEQATMAAGTTTSPSPQQANEEENDESRMSKELPLPPGLKHSGQIYTPNKIDTKTQMKKSASERRLLSNLSIKLPRSLSMMKKDTLKEEINKRKNLKLKADDSVWMKTIILGEKCKVPDEDEPVIFDSKGRRIPAYHPKSRQSSFIDPSAIPDKRMRRVDIETEMNQEVAAAEHKQENMQNAAESEDQD